MRQNGSHIAFKPQPGNKTKFPIPRMGFATLGLCLLYLLNTLRKKPSAPFTENYFRRFWKSLLSLSRTTVIVHGKDHVKSDKSYIFMANHRSLMDIPIILAAVPPHLRFVAKYELTKIPLFGRALIKSGNIPITRHDRKQAIEQLEKAKKQLKEGYHIFIAPEGTRQNTNALGRFKKGGFHTALDLKIPIVPVYIEGAERVIPSKSIRCVQNQEIHVYLGTPIATQNYSKETINELINRTRESMLNLAQKNL